MTKSYFRYCIVKVAQIIGLALIGALLIIQFGDFVSDEERFSNCMKDPKGGDLSEICR